MAHTLKEWVKEVVEPAKRKGKWYVRQFFYRDPDREPIHDLGAFFSPADGTIIFSQEVHDPNKKIIEVKGKLYSLKDKELGVNVNQGAVVISVFMTIYDVHINRVPYPGYITYMDLKSIKSYNIPMDSEENEILRDLVPPNDKNYEFNNARRITHVHSPLLDYTYYISQIADKEVDVINTYIKSGRYVRQNEKLGDIQYGSQVDLILPFPIPFKYKILDYTGWHIEAGVDRLIEIQLSSRKDHNVFEGYVQ